MRTNRDDLDPSYGIHLHDPRMMEYMGAPESARLLGRTPEYWLEHMGRERMVQAALRLHHDASLIMTNVQIMSQVVMSFSQTASEVMRAVHDSSSCNKCVVQTSFFLLKFSCMGLGARLVVESQGGGGAPLE